MKKTFLFFIFSFSIIFTNSTSYSQLAGWSADLPVTIKNNSTTAMTDCQVGITVNTQYLIGLGLMQPNGSDIRFGSDCGGTALYNYWIEGPINNAGTKLWVKVPSVPSNDSVRIIMFFGNPTAPAASTLTIFSGPHSATDSVVVSSLSPVLTNSAQRGFRFTPSQDLLVTDFGKREPIGNTRYVTLFRMSDSTIVKQIQVSGPALQYSYDSLIQPLWLTSGQQYLLVLYTEAGGRYVWGTSSQIGQHMTYVDVKYCNSCTPNTFPTSTLTNVHYGTPDLWYYVKENVTPAPTVVAGLPADTAAPTAPAGLTATAGDQQIQLKWNKNTQFDIQKYFIYRSNTNNPGSAALIDSVNHPDTIYTNTGLVNGNIYYYWVKAVDRFCVRRISAFGNVASATPVTVPKNIKIPTVFALYQNYPNPFNPVTSIKFDLPKDKLVAIKLYDLLGRELETTINQYFPAGTHEVRFNAENLASGVYFYKIEAGDYKDMKKMIVVK